MRRGEARARVVVQIYAMLLSHVKVTPALLAEVSTRLMSYTEQVSRRRQTTRDDDSEGARKSVFATRTCARDDLSCSARFVRASRESRKAAARNTKLIMRLSACDRPSARPHASKRIYCTSKISKL